MRIVWTLGVLLFSLAPLLCFAQSGRIDTSVPGTQRLNAPVVPQPQVRGGYGPDPFLGQGSVSPFARSPVIPYISAPYATGANPYAIAPTPYETGRSPAAAFSPNAVGTAPPAVSVFPYGTQRGNPSSDAFPYEQEARPSPESRAPGTERIPSDDSFSRKIEKIPGTESLGTKSLAPSSEESAPPGSSLPKAIDKIQPKGSLTSSGKMPFSNPPSSGTNRVPTSTTSSPCQGGTTNNTECKE